MARGGAIVYGRDFELNAGEGYVVNMLERVELQMDGGQFGLPMTDIPATAPLGDDGTWAFALVLDVRGAADFSPGATVRVANPRTTGATQIRADSNGDHMLVHVDAGHRSVIRAGDALDIEIKAENGYTLRQSAIRRISASDLRHASAVVHVDVRPLTTRLHACYPNPFNPDVWIPFELRGAADVRIWIYDFTGSRVRLLELGHRPAGYYVSRPRAAHWDGRTDVGELAASGVYVYELQADAVSRRSRMLLLR